jgi:hypothetical protein
MPYEIISPSLSIDRLCGLVVRDPSYRFRGSGTIPGAYIFWKVVGLERGPLSLVSTTEVLGRESSGSDLEKQKWGCRGSAEWLHNNLLYAKVGINFVKMWWSFGRNSLLVD